MRAPDRLRGFFIATGFAVLSVALVGASCDKKSVVHPTDPGPNVPFEAPNQPNPSSKPAEAGAPQSRFDQLAERLQSPCGKTESLKKSLSSGCKRAPFARGYLERMLKMDLSDGEIKDAYAQRYRGDGPYQFELKDAPAIGDPKAPIKIVEFFDYGCPHCRDKIPVIKSIVAAHPQDVVVFLKHFPLSSHKDSVPAARAAIAAYRQGKFEEMHEKLFANQGSQSKEDLFKYAKALGLDMAKFEADFNDPAVAAKVEADQKEGLEAKLDGTPTLYLDGRKYTDAITSEEIDDWIAEEKAVDH